MSAEIEAYPPQWPIGWPREDEPQYSIFKTGLVPARRGLMNELYLLGADDIVISSNARINSFGEIAARQKRVDDTGVAVYFTLHGEQKCIPCDKWVLLEDNIHAIELTVKALRGLERWGAQHMVDAAFQGFAALPEVSESGWWTALQVSRDAPVEEVDLAYRRGKKGNTMSARGEQVERMAMYMANGDADRGCNWYYDEDGREVFPCWDELPEDEQVDVGSDGDWFIRGKDYYRRLAQDAQRALEAVPDVEPIEDVLEGFAQTEISKSGDSWYVRVVRPKVDRRFGYDITRAHGATIDAAIRAAVDAAKEAGL